MFHCLKAELVQKHISGHVTLAFEDRFPQLHGTTCAYLNIPSRNTFKALGKKEQPVLVDRKLLDLDRQCTRVHFRNVPTRNPCQFRNLSTTLHLDRQLLRPSVESPATQPQQPYDTLE